MQGQGPWRSLARAVDQHGPTLDWRLTAPRATAAARRWLQQALRRPGLPATRPLDGSAAQAAALTSATEAHGPPRRRRQGQDCPNVVEQEQRAVQRVTRPRLGGKACAAAQDTLGGMELLPLMKQRQRVREAGDEGLPAAAWGYALAASSPPSQGQLPLHGPLSNICDRA